MAKKPTITTIASGYASNTQLNTNFTALRDGFNNTLSLDGSTPNAMNADLDMNSNDILNAGEVDVQGLKIDGVQVYPGSTQIATTYATQNYTGNGSTVTYAMGYNPAIKSNVDVYIDGVYQNQDAFGISGTDLIFTAAPPLNSAIEIKVPVNITSLTNTDSSQLVYTQGGVGASSRTVQSRLQDFVSVKDFGAVGDGVTDDTAAIQAAIDAVTEANILFPAGTYKVTSSITLKPRIRLYGKGSVISVASGVDAFVRSTDGFPGMVVIEDMRFVGTSDTGRAIYITNNTPFVIIKDCYFQDFDTAIEISGSYCSTIDNCHISSCDVGVKILNECHSTTIKNLFADSNRIGVAINGTNAGNEGTTPVHNISLIDCALQNATYGLWAEEVYELRIENMYHEGNTTNDMVLGAGDAGVYGRYCYHFIVDGWQSSSACASGLNIKVEHAVGGLFEGLAFNSGCSTTATLLSTDGFSDAIEVGYHRYSTTSPTSTAPFNFLGNSASKVSIDYGGRKVYPRNMEAIKFGDLASSTEKLYSGSVPSSGRPALRIESVGTNQDLYIKTTDLVRFADGSDNLEFAVDHLNNLVSTGYTVAPFTADSGNIDLGGAANQWRDIFLANSPTVSSDANLKQDVRDLSAAELATATAIKSIMKAYRFKAAYAFKGDDARIHVGVMAQDVRQAFENNGLDATRYGLFCEDVWYEVDGQAADPNTHTKYTAMTPNAVEKKQLRIRYEELLAFIIAAM